MVKVALVGLGFMGKMHLSVYSKLENVKLVAMCDVDEDALNLKTRGGGNIAVGDLDIDLSRVKKYTDYDKMLEDGGFDFVDICLPTYLHADFSIRAMEAGYHVFCEKPLSNKVEDAKKVVDKAKETGKLFSVGQCLRYWPMYTEVKRIIDTGKYGKVRYAEFGRFSMTPTWTWKNWILDGSLSGNAALDLHVHDVDMILFLFGFPKSVRSRGIMERDGSISHISTIYSYDDKLVTSTGGWICTDSFGFNARAFYILEKATIELDISKDPVVMVYPDDGEKYPLALPDGDGYYYELKDFAEGVERGELSGIVTPESAYDSVKLCLAEIESVKRKEEIEL